MHARSVTPRARHKRTLLAWLPARMRDELLGYERSQSEAFVPVDELFKLAASPTNKTSQENDERPLDHTELDIHDDCILFFSFLFRLEKIILKLKLSLFVLFMRIPFNSISDSSSFSPKIKERYTRFCQTCDNKYVSSKVGIVRKRNIAC